MTASLNKSSDSQRNVLPEAIHPALLEWFDRNGRHDLPWQHPRSAYRVWIAEIMLQQTQVATVVDYFSAFMTRFPNVNALAAADLDEVMQAWSGLGYYARARNLHAAARQVVEHHSGKLPRDFEALLALPGIGRSTAGAIVAQVWGDWAPILDGNAKRVLARLAAVEAKPGTAAFDKRLWQLARTYTPGQRVTDYTQAIMDLGATVCSRRRPKCDRCPLNADCLAYARGWQTALPVPRRKRRKPVRNARMMLIVDGFDCILLEKRPPNGVWGGLWSLPELPHNTNAAAYCRERLGLDIVTSQTGDSFRHAFTHFELDIEVTLLQAKRATRIIESKDQSWFDETDLPGVPAPIQRIVATRQRVLDL